MINKLGEMKLGMKTGLTPVAPMGNTMETNPGKRMGALRAAISQRRKDRVMKSKLITNNTQRPLNLEQTPIQNLDTEE